MCSYRVSPFGAFLGGLCLLGPWGDGAHAYVTPQKDQTDMINVMAPCLVLLKIIALSL